jgi:nucleoside-diphosphate-sugar epimerase
MNILLSGASGFLGKIIIEHLKGHIITTIGRNNNANLQIDLKYDIPILPISDIIIHSAGKAHALPRTEQDKQEIFDVNVVGTSNLLKGLENSSKPRTFIFISTVAVYGIENGNLISENNPLLAKDPYGLSKIKAEELVLNWCKKNSVTCTILRLPLIAGPNPPGNLGAMIKGIRNGYYFNIAGSEVKKSIVLAQDIAAIIPKVAEIGGIYNLTDGYHPSLKELSSVIAQQLSKKDPGNIPGLLAKSLAMIGDMLGKRAPINTLKLKKITSDLTFDDFKAREILGWNPTPVLKGFKIS